MTQRDEVLKWRETLNLDRILIEEVGQCGRFQLKVMVLCILLSAMAGQQTDLYLFTFAKVNTRCMIPECENSSQTNFTAPWILDSVPVTGDTFDNCHRFDAISNASSDICSAELFNRNSTVECQEYVYEHTNSAIYEYNLACDSWRPNLVGTVIALGDMSALTVGGFIADRWGRRASVASSGFSVALIGAMLYFANDYLSYLLIGFMSRVLGGCLGGMCFLLAVEFVGPRYRVAVCAILSSITVLGRVSTALIAATGLYWRHLLLTIHCPLIIAITYFWILPESIRWLMSKNRFQEAKAALDKAAQLNGNCLSEKTLQCFLDADTIDEKDEEKPGSWLVALVFKHKPILLRCIVTSVWWFATIFVYHGLAITSVGISGNRYVNYSLVAMASIPGFWITVLLFNKIGRKPVVIMSFWICGACQLAYIIVPKGHYWLSLSIYLVGKLNMAIAKTAISVYTTELFPTRFRARLYASSITFGYIGGSMATLAPAFADILWKHLPFAAFGSMAFLAGSLAFLTPETLGTNMPDTMEEAVDLSKGQDSGIMRALRRLKFRRKCYSVQ